MRPTEDSDRAKREPQPTDVAIAEPIEILSETAPFPAQLVKDLGLRGLHCGSGQSLVEGALNTDMEHLRSARGDESVADRIARVGGRHYYFEHDATEPFPFEDGSFDWVFSEHFLEHIPPLPARRWLAEMRRVVRAGGVIRISTPDLKTYVQAYLDPANRFFREHRERLTAGSGKDWPDAGRRAWWFNQIFRFWWHEFIYDFEELRHVAVKAGFEPDAITQCEFRRGRVSEVAQLDMEWRREESLYIEIARS